jgi:hypothetical protein
MIDKRVFRLISNTVRQRAIDAIWGAPEGHIAVVQEPTRSLDQNAAQWPILTAFAEQLEWPINGRMEKLSEEDWKDLLTAAFKREQARIAPGLDGGMVLLGQRTSQFGKSVFSEWLEFLHATAADRGVELHCEETV